MNRFDLDPIIILFNILEIRLHNFNILKILTYLLTIFLVLMFSWAFVTLLRTCKLKKSLSNHTGGSSFLSEEDHLHASSDPGVGGFGALLIRPLQDRDLRALRLVLAASVRWTSKATAPFATAPRQVGRFWSSVTQDVWSKPESFKEAFRLSLKRFFWPPWERAPAYSSPWRMRLGKRSSGILVKWPAQRSWVLQSISAQESLCQGPCAAISTRITCEGSYGESDSVCLHASGTRSRSHLHTIV